MTEKTAPRCFYFGCWNTPGHYTFCPGGRSARNCLDIELYGDGAHLDGTLAPRKDGYHGGKLFWCGQGKTEEGRQRLRYDGAECPQGHFLRHELDNGFTAIQWWDRCQGDTRGGCNSTILLEGSHTSEEMLIAAKEHFPEVLANLERGGVELVEVKLP